MRFLAQFQKTGGAQFVSHLDLMRAMQRALRRADVPVRFSKGFNPHPVMAFAQASPVGVESFAEYVDVALAKDCDADTLVRALNGALPPVLKASRGVCVQDGYPALMARVARAAYTVRLEGDARQNVAKWRAFFAQDEILAQKKGKAGVKTIDIKPMVFAQDMGEDGALCLILAAGSGGNLSPMLLLGALGGFLGAPVEARVTLEDVWALKDGAKTDLFSLETKGGDTP
nr:TIGR03936 family radical SAM-associated protein [Maliibacterium massiliense]